MNQDNKRKDGKRKFKGVLSSFMATAMTTSLLPISQTQAFIGFTDVPVTHWAYSAVNRLDTAGLMKGYSSTFFGEGDYIKRGDFAMVVNNLMGFEVVSDTFFTDLAFNDKYYNVSLYKLNAAGIMSGVTDTEMGAESDITREQACFILGKAFNLEESTTTSPFTDGSTIASYAKGYVQAMVEREILGGYQDGRFDPSGKITREQFAGILHNLASTIISDDYKDPYISDGTVVIRSNDYTLSDARITGDLILSEGISEGDIYLKNVTVEGNIIVKGGGVESIYLSDVTLEGSLLVSRQANPVRVVFDGSTTVSQVTVKNGCTLDTTGLSSSGYVKNLAVVAESYLLDTDSSLKDSLLVNLLGNYTSLSNYTAGVEVTTDGMIGSMSLYADTVIDGVEYEADTELNPEYPFEEPEIVITHDYGSAALDSSLIPEAVSSGEVTYFNDETGEVELEITVESVEDCMLMSNNANALSFVSPAGLEYTVERSTYSKYTVFEVAFTLEDPVSQVEFELFFKAEDEEPEVIIETNFNDITNASATVALAEDGISTASSGMTTAYIEVSRVRNCEPHYSTEYILSQADDLLGPVTLESYDEDDDIYTYKITFDSSELDEITVTMNFLEVDAQDTLPQIRGSLYYGDVVLDNRLGVDVHDLNEFGMLTVDIEVTQDLLEKSLKDEDDNYIPFQLKSSLDRAVTIIADSGETEFGYGLDYEKSLSHLGDTSTYTLTFKPTLDVEQVHFSIDVDEQDAGIPVMIPSSNLSRIDLDGVLEKYFVINQNTKTYSTKGVATVQVSVLDLEEITGYKLDSFDPFIVYDDQKVLVEGEIDEVYGTELKDYTVTKVGDDVYEISFTPNKYISTVDETEEKARKVKIQLNLEREENFVGLFGDTVSMADDSLLPYAKEVTELSSTHTYDYQLQLTVDNSDDRWTASNGYVWTDGSAETYADLDTSYIQLMLDESDEDNKEIITDKLKSLSVTVNESGTSSTINILFTTAARVNPEDLAFELTVPGSTVWVAPKLTVEAIDSTVGTASIVEDSMTFNSNTGATSVDIAVTVEDGYEIPSSGFFTVAENNYDGVLKTDAETIETETEETATVYTYTLSFNHNYISEQSVEIGLNFVEVLTPTVSLTADSAPLVSPLTSGTVGSNYTYEDYEYSFEFTMPEDYEFAQTILVNNFTLLDSSSTATHGVKSVDYDNTEKTYTVTFTSNNESAVAFDVDLVHSTGVISVTSDTELAKALATDIKSTQNLALTVSDDVTLNSTYPLASSDSITISAGKTLTIASGTTLTVDGTLTNSGELKNSGTLNVDGTYKGTGEVNNTGTINIDAITTFSGDVTNSGTGTINVNEATTTSGDVTNTGTVVIDENAELTVASTSTFANSGTLQVNGNFINNGTLTVTGKLLVDGTHTLVGTEEKAEAVFTSAATYYFTADVIDDQDDAITDEAAKIYVFQSGATSGVEFILSGTATYKLSSDNGAYEYEMEVKGNITLPTGSYDDKDTDTLEDDINDRHYTRLFNSQDGKALIPVHMVQSSGTLSIPAHSSIWFKNDAAGSLTIKDSATLAFAEADTYGDHSSGDKTGTKCRIHFWNTTGQVTFNTNAKVSYLVADKVTTSVNESGADVVYKSREYLDPASYYLTINSTIPFATDFTTAT